MNDRVKHLLVSMIWGGIGVLLLVLLLRVDKLTAGTQVLARAGPSSQTALSPVMRDTFDGTFTSTYHIQRQITATGEYMWGRVLTSSQGFTDTLWCVGGGKGISLTAGIDTYTDGVETTLTYGPIDFRNVVTAELSFERWISVAGGDGLEWGYSTDGASFTFHDVLAAPVGEWQTVTLSSQGSGELAPLPGERRVYLAFRFQSDSDGQVDRGVFLDNVQLQAGYDVHLYLPLAINDWFAAYEYQDNFSDWDSGWPYGDRRTVNPDGSVSEEFSYGYYRDVDDGSRVYRIFVRDDGDHVFLTGPQSVYAMRNFRYEASLRRVRVDGKDPPVWGDEYGILISPVQIDPKHPSGGPVYTLQVRLYVTGSGVQRWVVKRWTIEGSFRRSGDELGQGQESTFLTQDNKVWNRFKIEREGDVLKFFISSEEKSGQWKQVLTVTDDTLPDKMYIGFYAAHTKEYSYNMEYQFDNVYLYAYP